MKKALLIVFGLFFLICSSSFSQQMVETKYFSSHNELGGEAIILKSMRRVDGIKAITSFEIEVSQAGRYYISFWLCPPKLNDGTYANYNVTVNDKVVAGKIMPTKGDWQSISLSNGETIELNEGINIVSVIGTLPDIPSVEHIRVSSTISNSIIDSSKYERYKTDIIRESMANVKNNASATHTIVTDTLSSDDNSFAQQLSLRNEPPLYNYTFGIGMSFQYTFYKTVYFTQSQQVSITATTINGFSHILELFSSNSPENYSWFDYILVGDGDTELNVTIPQSGYYYVRVRSYANARSGLCNLNINNQNYYDNVPVYSIGVVCPQDTNTVYNTFTCHSTGDPRLWIQEGGVYGPIIAFNDDYHSNNGDYVWDLNSRVKKKYPRPTRAALLSSYGSYDPTGTCDLYIKCKNSYVDSFEQLKEDDAILSSPASFNYNCIAWTGGITSHAVWPLDSLSSYSAPDSLTAFDIFFASRGFTRVGATEANSVVDLWAHVDTLGCQDYTHASIRKGADGNAHGYDWESKTGDNDRLFHPRYALAGEEYGNVVEHYIRTTQNDITLEEEIANGTSRIEYVDFDGNEREIISRKINSINPEVLSEFQQLYDRWKNVTRKTIHSNPKRIADCDEYREILDYCKANKELLYAIYEKLGNGDGVAATKLIGDLTFSEYPSVMHKIRERVAYKPTLDGINTIRPLHSNYMSYVRELLALEGSETRKVKRNVDETTGISFSNSTDFEISLSANGLTVGFELNKTAKVSLSLIDLAGNVVCNAINSKTLESGKHSVFMKAEKNRSYLVLLMLNGRVNVKKILV
jgi:hypothetical protein